MKRRWTRFGALLMALLLLGACVPSLAEKAADPWDFSTANIDWRKYEGTELRLFLLQHMTTNALEKRLDQFTELTGIKVNLETLPESDYNSKMLIELNSGANPFDICQVSGGVMFASNGWLTNLWDYIDNPELTDRAFYNPDDFFASAIEYSTWDDGSLYAIPFSGEWQIMYYRKDLLDAKGIAVPTTLEELEQACAAVHDPDNGVYGIVARLKKGIGADVIYNNFLRAYNGEFLVRGDDGAISCKFDQPEAIEAADYYMSLLRDYGPPGQVNYGWAEAIAEVQQGKAAFFVDSTSFAGQILDPELSKVNGLIGYAPVPSGVAGSKSDLHFSHWCLTMGPLSEKKEAAWLFLQWATSTPMIYECGLEMGTSTRASLFESDGYKELYDQAFIDATLNGIDRGNRPLGWRLPVWSSCRDYIVAGLQEIYEGAAAADVMPRVAAEVTEVFRDS